MFSHTRLLDQNAPRFKMVAVIWLNFRVGILEPPNNRKLGYAARVRTVYVPTKSNVKGVKNNVKSDIYWYLKVQCK